ALHAAARNARPAEALAVVGAAEHAAVLDARVVAHAVLVVLRARGGVARLAVRLKLVAELRRTVRAVRVGAALDASARLRGRSDVEVVHRADAVGVREARLADVAPAARLAAHAVAATALAARDGAEDHAQEKKADCPVDVVSL